MAALGGGVWDDIGLSAFGLTCAAAVLAFGVAIGVQPAKSARICSGPGVDTRELVVPLDTSIMPRSCKRVTIDRASLGL